MQPLHGPARSGYRATLQRKAAGSLPPALSADRLVAGGADKAPPTGEKAYGLAQSQQGSGAPVAEPIRQRVEDVTGADLSAVQVHTGPAAAQAAQSVQAHAFTLGQDVYFNAGRYQPGTREGDRLIAHELVHTVQQGPGSAPQAKSAVSESHEPAEQEADRIADAVVDARASGTPVSVRGPSGLARKAMAFSELPPEQEAPEPQRPEPSEHQQEPRADQQPEQAQTAEPEAHDEAPPPPPAAAMAPEGAAAGGGPGGGATAAAQEEAAPKVPTEAATTSPTPEVSANPAPPVAVITPQPPAPSAAPPLPAPPAPAQQAPVASSAPAAATAFEAPLSAPSPAAGPTSAASPDHAPAGSEARKPEGAVTAVEHTEALHKDGDAKPATSEALHKDAKHKDAHGQPKTADARHKDGGAKHKDGDAKAQPDATATTNAKKEPEPTTAQSASPLPSVPAASADTAPGAATSAAPGAATSAAPAMAQTATQEGNKAAHDTKAADHAPAARAAHGGGGGGGGAASPKTADQDPGFQAVKGRAGQAGAAASAHAPAATKAAQAQGAAQSPAGEVQSQAEARHMGELAAEQPAPFSKEAFKTALRAKIAESAPKNLEEAANFKGNNRLGAVKDGVAHQVQEGKQQTAGPIEKKNQEAPSTAGILEKPVTPLAPEAPGAPAGNLSAAQAAPKPKAEAEISMQEGPRAVDQKMADAGVTEPQLQRSNEPKFQAAVTAKHSAQADADTAPGVYRQAEGPALQGARDGATATAEQHTLAMHGIKGAALQQALAKQGTAKTQDEQARGQVASKIRSIFQASKQKVEGRLKQLDQAVNAAFDQGAAAARKAFEDYVGQRMDAYKAARYSGVDGKLRWVKDLVFDLPSEVNVFYSDGKNRYLAAMEATLDRVAGLVEAGLREATAEVARGKAEVQTYVASLPASLRQVGQEAQQQIQGQFDQLAQSIKEKEGALVDSLAQKYNEQVGQLDARIGELKVKNKGLASKAMELVDEVIETVKKLKDMLLGVLARAAGVIDKILKDPIGFVGNLVAGAKAGFQRFAGNMGKHLKDGLMGWLLGKLGEAGIQLPESFDLKGIFGLVTQVLGVTYQAIRTKVAARLGEPAVAALEKAAGLLQAVKNGGIGALWEHMKEALGDLKALVLEPIKSFVMTKVITAGVTWVLSLLNPASAFIKACKAIYDIVMFFVERAAQITELVNAVLDGVEAVVGGAIDTMAAKIEGALAKALPVVISFLASLLGVGGISEKIRGVIQKLKAPIDKAIDWVVGKIVALGKKALGWVKGKFGKDKDGKDKDGKEREGKNKVDGEVGSTEHFQAGGENHRLWVETKGSTAVLMVASTPSPVENVLTSAAVSDFAKRSEQNKALVGEALRIAQTSKIDAQKALDYLKHEEKSDEFKKQDDALEAKEKRLMPLLKLIFNGLHPDEKLSTTKKLLQDRIPGLISRADRAEKAAEACKDPGKRTQLMSWVPITISSLKSELEGAKSLLVDVTDQAGFDMIQQDVIKYEQILVQTENKIGVEDRGESNEGSSLKRYQEVIAKPLTYSDHGKKHFRGGIANRQATAISTGDGQYKSNHSDVKVMEQQIIQQAAGGAGTLQDKEGLFYIYISRPGVGFVGGTGAENTIVRVEVLSSGTVHSHPE